MPAPLPTARPVPSSIAELLREEIINAPTTLRQIAESLDLNQPSLWRFVNEGVDPKLGTAEQLLRRFGYVVIREVDAKAARLTCIYPAEMPATRRREQRHRSAAARAKGTKRTEKAKEPKLPKPKRSSQPAPRRLRPKRA